MKYTVDYSHYPEWQAKIEAMKDAQDWLGKARFRKIVKLLKTDNSTPTHVIYMILGMVGIQGYPAQVMFELYVPKQLSFKFD